jgi:predicted MFS family arabinose efflux permease
VRAPSPRAASRGPIVAELAAGIRFAWSEPKVRHTLFLVAVTALFGLSYSTLLPVFARDVLHAGPTGYGVLLGGAGIGAIIGALLTASGRAGAGAGARLVAAQATLGLAFLALATSRHLAFAAVCIVAMGLAVSLQLSTTNAFLQLAAPPELRGRVLALYIWLFVGASPIGGFSAGWVAERLGAEATAAGAAVACLAGAAAGAMMLRRARGAGST